MTANDHDHPERNTDMMTSFTEACRRADRVAATTGGRFGVSRHPGADGRFRYTIWPLHETASSGYWAYIAGDRPVDSAVPDQPPQRLDNGANVWWWNLTHPGGNGLRRHGVALCNWQHSISEWVTWIVYRDEDGRWHAEHGHYFKNADEAIEDFKQRAGITSWEGMTS